MGMLDAAALHTDLQFSDTRRHYFAEVAAIRSALVDALVLNLGASDFAPYLLHNTTSGLLATLVAAARSGRSVRACGPQSQHYPAYMRMLPRGELGADWDFRTHVSPVTGAADELSSRRHQIVDAAQSLGTTLTPALLRNADVVLAPLHKHLGLVVGLGLVLVRRDSTELDQVHEVLGIAESGAQSLDLLRTAHYAAAKANGRIFNLANVVADDELGRWCGERGLRLLARGRGVPFACVTTADGAPINDRLAPTCWRHFRSFNTARFSFHRAGFVTDPAVDHTSEFRESVEAALRKR